MLQAIISTLNLTWNAFITIKSKETKKRALGKLLSRLMHSLRGISQSVEQLERVFPLYSGTETPEGYFDRWHFIFSHFSDHLDFSETKANGSFLHLHSRFGETLSLHENSDGSVTVTTSYTDASGQPAFSSATLGTEKDAVDMMVRYHVGRFKTAFGRFAALVAEETCIARLEFDRELQEKLAIYDQRAIELVSTAWSEDGGFIEALDGLGLDLDAERALIKILDLEFNPPPGRHWAFIYSRATVRTYELSNRGDIELLVDQLKRTRGAIDSAAEALRTFVVAHFSIEEIL